MPLSHLPEGYHSVTPYLIVDNAAAAIDFYARAFGAGEVLRLPMGDKIAHAEILIGDSHIMLADEFPEMGHQSPKTRGGPTASFMIYVRDVDDAFARALGEGATEERAVEDQFYGDRAGTLLDPFGHRWTIATQVEVIPPEELERRMTDWMEKQEG
jgi:PhnB protein